MYNFSSNKKRSSSNTVYPTDGSPIRLPRPAVTSKPRKVDAQSIVILNRKRTRPDSQAFFDKTVGFLDEALDAIFDQTKLPFPNQFLYVGVENICKQAKAEELFIHLVFRLKSHASNKVQPSLFNSISSDLDPIQALVQILEQWNIWQQQTKSIRSIFYYLERSFLLSRAQSLHDVAKDVFLNHVIGSKLLLHKALSGVCLVIAQSRTNDVPIDNHIAVEAVVLFSQLGLYNSALQPKVLEESQLYFERQSVVRGEQSLIDYVDWVYHTFAAEFARCDILQFTSYTKRSMMESIELLAIKYRVQRLVALDEIEQLLDKNDVTNLEKVYSLLDKVNQTNQLIQPLQHWILDRGTQIVLDDQNEDQMVLKLLAFKRQIDNIWIKSFHRHAELAQQSRQVFEEFMNKTRQSKANFGTDNTKQGEMIAKYVNMLLEGGSKVIPPSLIQASTQPQGSEGEENEVVDEDRVIDEQLDQVLDLFRFVHGKAVFEAFYKKDLARRLLLGRSASQDAEFSMIVRLKNECGSNFTQNLETMFKDMELSREEMTEYKSRQAETGHTSSIDLDVHVLSAAAWPSYPDTPFNVHHQVQIALSKFELNYQSHHSNRKLFWKYALHHAYLVARFPTGVKELVVSAFQAAVLIMFSTTEIDHAISYEEIKAQTQLLEHDLKLTLQSLACAKIRPLRKYPEGREISPTDRFTVNAKFTSPRYRVKINRIQQKETKKETKETHERVQLDREFETQAAIVRIMKSKKEMPHNLLMAEVIDATKKRGTLTPQAIKKQIDRLIEKDYICHLEDDDPNKKGIYGYVA